MKIVEMIKKKYFPHKVKLVKGEQRTYLTELDKAFIYACKKLNLLNNRLGWYHPQTEINWLDDYKANKYDFFKFNVEVQAKCWETGHLKEIVGQMTMKLSDASYWKPFFKLMSIFNHKDYNLGFKVYRFAKIVAAQGENQAIFRVIIFCLDDLYPYTSMSWEKVYMSFEVFFNCQTDDEEERRRDSYDRNYYNPQSKPMNSGLKEQYCSILGVSSNPTKGEIKAAYRKLVVIHHPDRGGKTENFIKIQEAYEYLINN